MLLKHMTGAHTSNVGMSTDALDARQVAYLLRVDFGHCGNGSSSDWCETLHRDGRAVAVVRIPV